MNLNDRDELTRLLPGPVERDLPGDRHHQLQEFVMSEIHRDPRTTRQAPRRPLVRRSILVTSTLAAVAAVAAAVGIAATGQPGDGPVPPRPATLSGQELLLAAANTALRQPAGAGTYWHVTVVSKDAAKNVKAGWETWADRDGVNWLRLAGGMPDPNNLGARIDGPVKRGERGFSLGGTRITFAQLRNLPTTPDALKASLTEILTDAGIVDDTATTDSRRRHTPDELTEHVLYGLVALVSLLPAPPTVRAAAFRAIAGYPGVVNLGPVDGGQALQVPVHQGSRARLVVDPAAAQVRETDFLVMLNGTGLAVDGGASTITAEWTDSLPA
jgi:hypothetical protein